MSARLPPEGVVSRALALRLIWRTTHRDYRGTRPDGTRYGTRSILVLRAGGTCSVALDDLTDDEIRAKLPQGYELFTETETK